MSNKKELSLIHLNNDVLNEILSYLNINDKLNMELVCKRFYHLPKFHWNNVKGFNVGLSVMWFFDQTAVDDFFTLELSSENLNYANSILKLCGEYIDAINIYHVSEENFDICSLLKILISNCSYVRKICIHVYVSNSVDQYKEICKFTQELIKKQQKLDFCNLNLILREDN